MLVMDLHLVLVCCCVRFVFRRFLRALYSAPRLELQGLHAGTMSVSSPAMS